MSETIANKLVSAFSDAWHEVAPKLLWRPSELSLLSLREMTGDELTDALRAATGEWSSAFAVSCQGFMSGAIGCLLKAEDGRQIENIIGNQREAHDEAVIAGGQTLISDVFKQTAQRLSAAVPEDVVFGEAQHIDLTADKSDLSTVVGDAAWIGTFSLSLSDGSDTQLLLLYAPHSSPQNKLPNVAPHLSQRDHESGNAPSAAAAPPSLHAGHRAQRPRDDQPRNIERLLDVELEVVVRFGLTTLALREVVGMGIGTMIELDRSVNEPVDLLVNGRQFARGEVVVIDGYYGVRVTEVQAAGERPISLV